MAGWGKGRMMSKNPILERVSANRKKVFVKT